MKKIPFFLFCLVFTFATAQTRLDTIRVAHYDIHLQIVDLQQQTISGYTNLFVVPQMNGVTSIRLDLQQLTVDSVKLNDQITAFNYVSPFLQLTTAPLSLQDTQKVTVYYHGSPVRDPYWGGFYFTSQYAYNMGVGMQSVPPSFGRCWYPCIDDFQDKATYQFHIETNATNTAVAGGILVDSLTLPSGNRVWSWELDNPIPTYLASIAVGPYQVYKDTIYLTEGVIPIEIYAPETSMSKIAGSFVNLKTVARGFEERFGTYVWPRIGYVLVPFSSGAMEHATNIAYPIFAVNGGTTYQDLLIHEFSHSWFGNLLTCSEAQTMWINEGFARYSEIIAEEILDPTGATALQSWVTLHRYVLKKAHQDDGGYFALNQVPQSATYGTTTYDKGGVVVHGLRKQMGDSLFFASQKLLFDQNRYGNVNSLEYFQKMSVISGLNLIPFYEGWVNQAGFPQFAVDEVVPLSPTSPNHYLIRYHQKHSLALNCADHVCVDVAFYGNSGEYCLLENLIFSGETGQVEVEIPFTPQFWIVDPLKKLADAVIDEQIVVLPTSMVTFNDGLVRLKSTHPADSVLVYVEYNMVAPDPLQNPNPNVYQISDKHYWKIEYPAWQSLTGELHFRYSINLPTDPDYSLIEGYSREDLILLYRRNGMEDWRIVPSTLQGNPYTGFVITSHTAPGEYLLAVGDQTEGTLNYLKESKFKIYPNPSQGTFYTLIEEALFEKSSLSILDPTGVLVYESQLFSPIQQHHLDHLSVGLYLVEWRSNQRGKQILKLMIQ